MARSDQYAQHFLRSPRVVAELVGHSNIRKNDVVYDLGAGSGVIASVLARRAKQVIAVEIEPEAVKKLRSNVGLVENVTIITQDILDIIPETRYKIFANIPFSLSSDVVRHFTSVPLQPTSMYVIVQKQFAMKLTPSDAHFNSELGAELWPWFSVRIRRPLKRTDFTPPPAVDTVLLEIKPLETPLLPLQDQEKYKRFVAKCFAEQLYFAKQPKAQAGIDAARKPSEVRAEQWVRLYSLSR